MAARLSRIFPRDTPFSAGFDFAHHAAPLRGFQQCLGIVDCLLDHGADPTIRDKKVHNPPDGWADYAHHSDLAGHLRSARDRRAG